MHPTTVPLNYQEAQSTLAGPEVVRWSLPPSVTTDERLTEILGVLRQILMVLAVGFNVTPEAGETIE